MDVVVRRATPVDVPGLAWLRWRWRIEDRGEHTDLDRESFVDLFTTWVLDHAATHLPFVAEVDGRLVGMVWLLLYHRVPSPRALDRHAGDIQSVYVMPEPRANGVGAQLIGAVIRHARETEFDVSDRAFRRYRRRLLSQAGLRRRPAVDVVPPPLTRGRASP